ncbi:MAG: DUF3800 domain-containing protein [Chloroflexi bacterium]|nr:DUF3800 domain-containing protein [Chloroflexota bacterium]
MTYFVYVDESGNLLDRSGRFFVVAAVGTGNPRELSGVVKKVRAWLKQRGKQFQNVIELRFFSAGRETRIKFFELLAQVSDAQLYLLIIAKDRLPLGSAPEIFAQAALPLFTRILSDFPHAEFVLDKQFTNPTQRAKVNRELEARVGRKLKIEHGESQTDVCLQIADFVAGAGMAKYQNEEEEYLELVAQKIYFEQMMNWSEIEKW